MQNLPQPVSESSSALARVGLCLLVPVAGILLLPILLLFIVVLYLLALFQGGRFLFFSFSGKPLEMGEERQRPHFLDLQEAPKALTDESKRTD